MTNQKRDHVTLHSAVGEALSTKRPAVNPFAELVNRLQGDAASSGRIGMFGRRPKPLRREHSERDE